MCKMEEQLIAAVQKRPCLFDKNSITYRNRLAKERAWKQVSQIVGASVKNCMVRWRSLRDRYVKETAKHKDVDMVGRPTWRYLRKMSFIQKHVASRKLLESDNTFDDTINPEEFILSEIVADTNPGEFKISISKRSNDSNNESYEEEIFPMIEQYKCSETPPRPETPPKKRQKMQENAHERFEKLCGAVTDLIESKKQSYHKSRNEDFLKVLDSYLLKLSEEEQDNLKIQILNMVHVNPLD